MMNMGEKIRMHRLRRSMTQERLSQSVGVTAQAVSKWESGVFLSESAYAHPDRFVPPEYTCSPSKSAKLRRFAPAVVFLRNSSEVKKNLRTAQK